MRAVIGDSDMAVWRSNSGVVSAWDNRCPHRGMRLSHGFVRGESLACAYHGWHYNCEGYCHFIPAHPELTPPKTVRPVMHGIAEQGGIIWVNTEGDARPVTLADTTQPIRSITFNCALSPVLEALPATPLNSDEPADIQTLADSPRVLALNCAALSDQLYIALQQSQPQRTVAHVVSGNSMTTEERLKLSGWLESLRRRAESTQARLS